MTSACLSRHLDLRCVWSVCVRAAYLLAGLFTLLSEGQTSTPGGRPPNIIIVVSDDQGWNDVGWRNPEVMTPHLDRLARTGVRLEQHYVASMCTPTRASLLTGRFATRYGISLAQNEQALRFGTETLASSLQKQGYETALIGKWHLGSLPEQGPQRFGFDYGYGVLAGGCGPYSHLYKAGPYSRTWHRNGTLIDEEGHVTDLLMREAVKWLGERRGEKPFFLYLPFTAPHVPVEEPERYLSLYPEVEPLSRRHYYASISHMDAAIGEVMAALVKTGQSENTLLLFLCDNGATPDQLNEKWLDVSDPRNNFAPGPGGGSNFPLRGKKTQVFEGGIRVPAFIRWPAMLTPGTFNGVLHAIDWMPTLTELAGFSAKPSLKWDGRDVWPDILRNQAKPRQLYWVSARWQHSAVRDADWKMILTHADDSVQLFNLAEDPNETTDLAAREPGRVATLRQLLGRLAESDNDARFK